MGEKKKNILLCYLRISPKENSKQGRGKQLHEHTDTHTHTHSGLKDVRE